MTADFKQSANLAGTILAGGQVANATTDTTVYTVPGSSAVKIATFSITNTSTTAAVVVSVSVVPSGGTVDGTHKVVSAYTLAAGDSTKITEIEGAMLDTGALISINVDTAAKLNYLITGAVAS
jgi:hypothetical protein